MTADIRARHVRIARELRQGLESRRDAVKLSVHADGSVTIATLGGQCITLSKQAAFRLAARLIVLASLALALLACGGQAMHDEPTEPAGMVCEVPYRGELCRFPCPTCTDAASCEAALPSALDWCPRDPVVDLDHQVVPDDASCGPEFRVGFFADSQCVEPAVLTCNEHQLGEIVRRGFDFYELGNGVQRNEAGSWRLYRLRDGECAEGSYQTFAYSLEPL